MTTTLKDSYGRAIRDLLPGDEPMTRCDIETIIEKLAQPKRLRDLALTTNEYFLPQPAPGLRYAG